jgi:hypothetical protein
MQAVLLFGELQQRALGIRDLGGWLSLDGACARTDK